MELLYQYRPLHSCLNAKCKILHQKFYAFSWQGVRTHPTPLVCIRHWHHYAISRIRNGWELWIFLLRRLRGDMIETYKVISGIYDTSVSPEIPTISEYATRGNSLKVANRRCHYNLRKYSFSMRITNVWNSLPSLSLLPLQSTHLKIDWVNIGHHKNLDTIEKQNYQESGVEAELNFEFFEFTIISSKERYGHRSISLTPITSALLCYVILRYNSNLLGCTFSLASRCIHTASY